MKVRIIKYSKDENTCICVSENGNSFQIDPFVACGIEMTDEQYKNNFGFSLVGKWYELSESCFISDNVFCPDNTEIREIS